MVLEITRMEVHLVTILEQVKELEVQRVREVQKNQVIPVMMTVLAIMMIQVSQVIQKTVEVIIQEIPITQKIVVAPKIAVAVVTQEIPRTEAT